MTPETGRSPLRFSGWEALSSHQVVVTRQFLRARNLEHRHLVVYLSGAHAYGFPSPDSDLDLKCVHVAPTRLLVGLHEPQGPPDRIEIVEGVELDYGSNELGAVLRGVIRGNGNFAERILGDLALDGEASWLEPARRVVRALLSCRMARHYAGFATSQLIGFKSRPTAKRALYVLRTAATGRCLLRTGEVVTDVAHLGEFLPAEIGELLAIKQGGERGELASSAAERWNGVLADAIAAVDLDVARAVVPAEPSAEALASAEDWLLDVRRAWW